MTSAGNEESAAGGVRADQPLATLAAPLRETLVLREVQELSYREIAEVTEVSIDTVMSRLAGQLFPQAIWLDPDDSGRFLWAVYAVDDEVLRSALFDDPAYRYSSADVFPPVQEKSACVVAGA
jgi:hypothetical protein